MDSLFELCRIIFVNLSRFVITIRDAFFRRFDIKDLLCCVDHLVEGLWIYSL